jgi:methionyl aminopeptidase
VSNVLIVNFDTDKNLKMSITTEDERIGMQQASNAVAITLKKMREFAKPGISTKELDEYGGELLAQMGARSAPTLTYGFPGYTCISINEEAAHGIPSVDKILKKVI